MPRFDGTVLVNWLRPSTEVNASRTKTPLNPVGSEELMHSVPVLAKTILGMK